MITKVKWKEETEARTFGVLSGRKKRSLGGGKNAESVWERVGVVHKYIERFGGKEKREKEERNKAVASF